MLLPIFTPEQFAVALQSPRPVLTMWGQPGCGACQATHPELRRFANHHPEVDAWEVNCTLLETLADAHRISATPTLILFIGGRQVARQTDEHDEARIERFVGRHVK